MKKIIGLTIAALLIIGIVGAGTFAYFSDTETSANNTFTAGTLNLGLANVSSNSTGSATATWTSPSNWAPGDNVSATLYVNNAGTINMSSVNVTFSHVLTEGTPATVDAGPGGNTDNLTKMITAESATWDGTSVAAITGQTLDQLIAAGSINLASSLPSGTPVPFFIRWRFNTSATNGCQGDSENVTLTVTGIQ
jgi:predicted ribosomally synthesized peptide with SipW-like signal peptide